LAVTDSSGKVAEGEARPPSEFALHLGCYAERSDVRAIVHAHPPYATAMACAGKSITTFLAEAIVSLGPEVPLARFALPFGAAGAAPLRELIGGYDALLLQSHGVITVGPSLELALLRMELVEHMAKIATLAQPHGGVQPLPSDVLGLLIKKRRGAGLGQAADRTSLPDGIDEAVTPLSEPVSGGAPMRSVLAQPGPAPGPTESWRPAGPPPAADAWSGGRTEGACGIVYGASVSSPTELKETVAAAVAKHLKND
jgi:L-fuculose-phosphate aldolase